MWGRNSFAAVFNANAIGTIVFMSNRDSATFAIEFDCVVDQVREHLDKLMRVSENFGFLIDKIVDSNLSSRGGCGEARDNIFDQRIELNDFRFHLYVSGLDRAQFQNVIDEAVHAVSILLNDGKEAAIVLGVFDGAVFKRLGQRSDRS